MKRYSWKTTVFMVLGCLVALTFAPPSLRAQTLDIYWIDTEGGAATLIVTPEKESILVDTGNPGYRDADRIVRLATQQAKLTRIDHLVITHFHKDHFGGASTLAHLIPIGHVYDNGIFDGMPDRPDASYFEFPCEKRTTIEPGDVIPLRMASSGPSVKIICLAARQKFVPPETVNALPNPAIEKFHQLKDRDGSDNANSIVLKLSFGDFRFFDGGDLTWNQEFNLVYPHNLIGSIDVYQVTHHGLDSSNNPVVLKTIQPKVAIMNNGHMKGCLPSVFADLKETSSIEAIYQVHRNLRPDGAVNNVAAEFIANDETAEQCQGHPIHLSVAADSRSYTVNVPSKNHSTTYTTKSQSNTDSLSR